MDGSVGLAEIHWGVELGWVELGRGRIGGVELGRTNHVRLLRRKILSTEEPYEGKSSRPY